MNEVKFSIAISAYKGIYLKDCIASILNQSYPDFELIILNDASPDNILDIVSSFDDIRIRFYENEKNVGAIDLVDNWNKCLSLANGEFFMQMGDDDLLDANYLAEFSKVIERYPQISVFHCRSFQIDETDEIIGLSDPLPVWEPMSSAIYYRMKDRIQFISDFVYRTNDLRKAGGFYKMPLAWFSDDLTALMLAKEFGLANVNEPVFRYRVNRHSITSTGNCLLKMEAIIKAYGIMRSLLKVNKPLHDVDKFLTKRSLDIIDFEEMRRKGVLMALDLRRNGFSQLTKWILNRKKMKLNLKTFAYALYVLSVRNRVL